MGAFSLIVVIILLNRFKWVIFDCTFVQLTMATSYNSHTGEVNDRQRGPHAAPQQPASGGNTAAGNSQEVIAFSTIVLNYVLPQVVKDVNITHYNTSYIIVRYIEKVTIKR